MNLKEEEYKDQDLVEQVCALQTGDSSFVKGVVKLEKRGGKDGKYAALVHDSTLERELENGCFSTEAVILVAKDLYETLQRFREEGIFLKLTTSGITLNEISGFESCSNKTDSLSSLKDIILQMFYGDLDGKNDPESEIGKLIGGIEKESPQFEVETIKDISAILNGDGNLTELLVCSNFYKNKNLENETDNSEDENNNSNGENNNPVGHNSVSCNSVNYAKLSLKYEQEIRQGGTSGFGYKSRPGEIEAVVTKESLEDYVKCEISAMNKLLKDHFNGESMLPLGSKNLSILRKAYLAGIDVYDLLESYKKGIKRDSEISDLKVLIDFKKILKFENPFNSMGWRYYFGSRTERNERLVCIEDCLYAKIEDRWYGFSDDNIKMYLLEDKEKGGGNSTDTGSSSDTSSGNKSSINEGNETSIEEGTVASSNDGISLELCTSLPDITLNEEELDDLFDSSSKNDDTEEVGESFSDWEKKFSANVDGKNYDLEKIRPGIYKADGVFVKIPKYDSRIETPRLKTGVATVGTNVDLGSLLAEREKEILDDCENLSSVVNLKGINLLQREFYVATERLNMLTKKKINYTEALNISLKLLEAYSQINEKRIVHRDIALRNIGLDQDGNYVFFDFGIALRESEIKQIKTDCPSRKKDIETKSFLPYLRHLEKYHLIFSSFTDYDVMKDETILSTRDINFEGIKELKRDTDNFVNELKELGELFNLDVSDVRRLFTADDRRNVPSITPETLTSFIEALEPLDTIYGKEIKPKLMKYHELIQEYAEKFDFDEAEKADRFSLAHTIHELFGSVIGFNLTDKNSIQNPSLAWVEGNENEIEGLNSMIQRIMEDDSLENVINAFKEKINSVNSNESQQETEQISIHDYNIAVEEKGEAFTSKYLTRLGKIPKYETKNVVNVDADYSVTYDGTEYIPLAEITDNLKKYLHSDSSEVYKSAVLCLEKAAKNMVFAYNLENNLVDKCVEDELKLIEELKKLNTDRDEPGCYENRRSELEKTFNEEYGGVITADELPNSRNLDVPKRTAEGINNLINELNGAREEYNIKREELITKGEESIKSILEKYPPADFNGFYHGNLNVFISKSDGSEQDKSFVKDIRKKMKDLNVQMYSALVELYLNCKTSKSIIAGVLNKYSKCKDSSRKLVLLKPIKDSLLKDEYYFDEGISHYGSVSLDTENRIITMVDRTKTVTLYSTGKLEVEPVKHK